MPLNFSTMHGRRKVESIWLGRTRSFEFNVILHWLALLNKHRQFLQLGYAQPFSSPAAVGLKAGLYLNAQFAQCSYRNKALLDILDWVRPDTGMWQLELFCSFL